jgi:hypothetical protein
MAIVNDIVKLDLQKNQKHVWLAEFIRHQGELFEKAGGEARVQTGPDGVKREFRSRAHYLEEAKKDPSAANRYWTLTDQDVIGLLRANARLAVERDAAAILKDVTDSGFVPSPPPAPSPIGTSQPPAPPPQPTPSPKAISYPMPGSADGSVSLPTAFTQRELLALGVPLPK